MFGLRKKIEELEWKFNQYKYDQANLPLYKVGQILSDGTVITKVERHRIGIFSYEWHYDGITDGVLVKGITPKLIEDRYELTIKDLNDRFNHVRKGLQIHAKSIHKLSYQVNNPPLYKIGQKVKEYGVCADVKLITVEVTSVLAEHHYEYTFIKNNKTMTVSE